MNTIKKLFLPTVLLLLMFGASSCSKDTLDHGLDGTVWIASESPNVVYTYGLSFRDGYMNRVEIDVKTGMITSHLYSAKYVLNRAKGVISLTPTDGQELRVKEYTYKEGYISGGGYRYFQK